MLSTLTKFDLKQTLDKYGKECIAPKKTRLPLFITPLFAENLAPLTWVYWTTLKKQTAELFV